MQKVSYIVLLSWTSIICAESNKWNLIIKTHVTIFKKKKMSSAAILNGTFSINAYVKIICLDQPDRAVTAHWKNLQILQPLFS